MHLTTMRLTINKKLLTPQLTRNQTILQQKNTLKFSYLFQSEMLFLQSQFYTYEFSKRN